MIYQVIEPTVPAVPIIVSVPHVGMDFPTELRDNYVETKRHRPDDTDWYVHDLYNFVTELGITMIHAQYSRWVIDLNRDPQGVALYDDGRIITGLTPTTDFFGDNIYKNGHEPDVDEVNRRLNTYYWPYYKKVQELLDERRAQYGKVLLWDAHSIRRHVPTIQQDYFPDMILGDNLETTADKRLIKTTLAALETSPYKVAHNTPFKGGHITRYFGKPGQGQHALQLEMNKILYMDDAELSYHLARAAVVRDQLKNTFLQLINTIQAL